MGLFCAFLHTRQHFTEGDEVLGPSQTRKRMTAMVMKITKRQHQQRDRRDHRVNTKAQHLEQKQSTLTRTVVKAEQRQNTKRRGLTESSSLLSGSGARTGRFFLVLSKPRQHTTVLMRHNQKTEKRWTKRRLLKQRHRPSAQQKGNSTNVKASEGDADTRRRERNLLWTVTVRQTRRSRFLYRSVKPTRV